MIIAVDFDGTLHTGRWPDTGILTPYAGEIMRKLKADGHYIIIWTCREGQRQTDMINWLLEHNIPFDRVNDNHPECVKLYSNNSRKVYYDILIDDKIWGGLPTWPEIYGFIQDSLK